MKAYIVKDRIGDIFGKPIFTLAFDKAFRHSDTAGQYARNKGYKDFKVVELSLERGIEMSKNIINLTPHEVNILSGDKQIDLEPSGTVARCYVERDTVGEINGIPLTQNHFGQVTGLPDPEKDTFYIVSALVANACKERDDLVIPDETVRDGQGCIIGCRSLARV